MLAIVGGEQVVVEETQAERFCPQDGRSGSVTRSSPRVAEVARGAVMLGVRNGRSPAG